MRRHARYSIAALRKWRRTVSAAVVPAFAAWSLSAAACFGMPPQLADEVPIAAHASHDMSTPHAAHGTASDMHEHTGMADCAHCPPKVDDNQPAPTICLGDGTSNANAPKASAAPDFFKMLSESRLPALSWTAAPPPPIHAVVAIDSPYAERRPLNVRHCVFLI